jgi:hypothetical protein
MSATTKKAPAKKEPWYLGGMGEFLFDCFEDK